MSADFSELPAVPASVTGGARVVIVTPARPSSNNGNWQTTARWSDFLAGIGNVSVENSWDGQPADLMIALHARRSADSIRRFAALNKPLVVVLTGTDLYRDIRSDPSAQQSLALADRLVVLQSAGLDELSEDQRRKCVVIEQSAPALDPLPPRKRTFDLCLAGHLRAEKDPLTALQAVSLLPDPSLRLRCAGRFDDPDIGPVAQTMALDDPRIELLGPLAHQQTRDLIRQCRLLLLPSVMEGGANVLIEAVTSGVPVLASRIPGSTGLLGDQYQGLFPVGDHTALAGMIGRCQRDPQWLASLLAQCRQRAPLFDPLREAALVRKLVSELLMPASP